jgi:LacI family transcriptional regulator
VSTGTSRVRLEEVAREAGVSKSTASRVLNGAPALSVRDDTRQRIHEAARVLGYRPHAGARALRRTDVGAVALTVPTLETIAYTRIIRGAVVRDVAVLVLEDGPASAADPILAGLIGARRIDGVMIASSYPQHPLIARLSRDAVPHVFVNRGVAGSSRNVTMDDDVAGALAVDHLADLGHRRIGHVAGPLNLDPAARRAAGMQRRAAERGLEPVVIVSGDFSEAGGDRAARDLLRDHPEVTGLFASSVGQTVGTLHAVVALGRRVPQDVSLVGYDDTTLADYLHPGITTVRMPFDGLGAAGLDAVLAQIHGAPAEDVQVLDPPKVVVRGSTAPPRDDGP